MRKTPPPLSRPDLQDIKQRRRNDPDVVALLWEVSRLRGTVLKADQFERSVGPTGGMVQMIREMLRERLNAEPAVTEFPRLTNEKKT